MDLTQVAEIIVVLKNGERIQYRGNGLEKLRKEMRTCASLRPKPSVRIVEEDEPDTPVECDEDGTCPIPQPEEVDEEDEDTEVVHRKVTKKTPTRKPGKNTHAAPMIDPALIAAHSKGYHVTGLNYAVSSGGSAQEAAREMQKQAAARGLSFG